MRIEDFKRLRFHFFNFSNTGGPRISWFLVPKPSHEIRGSRIVKLFLSIKYQIGSKSFLKSTFLAIFLEIAILQSHNTIIRFILTCFLSYLLRSLIKSTVMRKSAKQFNIFGWLFPSLIEKSKVPIQTSYLTH